MLLLETLFTLTCMKLGLRLQILLSNLIFCTELVKMPPHRAGMKRSGLNNAFLLKICDLWVVPCAECQSQNPTGWFESRSTQRPIIKSVHLLEIQYSNYDIKPFLLNPGIPGNA